MCWFRPRLDHIFVRLGLAPPPQHLFHCPVFMLTPAWKIFLVGNRCDNTQSKFIYIRVNFTLTIPKLMDRDPSHAKWASWFKWPGIITLVDSHQGRVPTQMWAGGPGREKEVGGMGPNQLKMWSSPGCPVLILIPINVMWQNYLCKSLGIYSQCWK